METVLWSGDTYIRKLSASEELSPEAFVVYHGFPGEPAPDEVEKFRTFPRKFVDVAQAVHAETHADVFMPHYEGLGESRGKFSFLRAVERSIALGKEIFDRGYRRLHVVGNSWGGLCGFNAHRELGSRKYAEPKVRDRARPAPFRRGARGPVRRSGLCRQARGGAARRAGVAGAADRRSRSVRASRGRLARARTTSARA